MSRTQLVMAATGKSGGAAREDARTKGTAGEVIDYLLTQCQIDLTLLDPDKNRTLYLVELKQAPREHWPLLSSLLVEHEWSANKDTKAAVERIKAVAESVRPICIGVI